MMFLEINFILFDADYYKSRTRYDEHGMKHSTYKFDGSVIFLILVNEATNTTADVREYMLKYDCSILLGMQGMWHELFITSMYYGGLTHEKNYDCCATDRIQRQRTG